MNFIKACYQAKLFEYGPTKGTIFITPNGFDIWQKIQKNLDYEFKQLGVENVYFPSLFPYSMLAQEEEHIDGFKPEIFTIEQTGNKKLNDKLVLRPTSEVVFCSYFQKVLKSYRDLPLLLNQWVNVWRYEQNPNPFLRNMEFLWNEGHTLHLNETKATEFCHKILNIYRNFLQKKLLIPVFVGYKSELEKFAGAEKTWGLETILPDGQFLQLATVHYFGQNFAEKFDVKFLNKENKGTTPYQTSWGISTRAIAGLVQTHFDNKGLILPFLFAKYQILILPIYMKKANEQNLKITNYCKLLQKRLVKNNFKVKLISEQYKKNFSYHCLQSEIIGTPMRLEIGKQEVLDETVTFVFRHNLKQKRKLSFEQFFTNFNQLYQQMNKELYDKATKIQNLKIEKIINFEKYLKLNKNKAFEVWFCNKKECEKQIKQLTKTVSRILWKTNKINKCFKCQKKTKYQAFFGRSY